MHQRNRITVRDAIGAARFDLSFQSAQHLGPCQARSGNLKRFAPQHDLVRCGAIQTAQELYFADLCDANGVDLRGGSKAVFVGVVTRLLGACVAGSYFDVTEGKGDVIAFTDAELLADRRVHRKAGRLNLPVQHRAQSGPIVGGGVFDRQGRHGKRRSGRLGGQGQFAVGCIHCDIASADERIAFNGGIQRIQHRGPGCACACGDGVHRAAHGNTVGVTLQRCGVGVESYRADLLDGNNGGGGCNGLPSTGLRGGDCVGSPCGFTGDRQRLCCHISADRIGAAIRGNQGQQLIQHGAPARRDTTCANSCCVGRTVVGHGVLIGVRRSTRKCDCADLFGSHHIGSGHRTGRRGANIGRRQVTAKHLVRAAS